MPRKHFAVTLLIVALAMITAAPILAAGDEAKGKPQTVCPVMGGAINKDLYVDYQGQRVYFCQSFKPFKPFKLFSDED